MTNEEFDIEVESAYTRSRRVLLRKGKEYSGDIDRLENFKRAGEAENVPATQALNSLAMKHVISISDMVKHPKDFTLKQWHEKTGDLRNYTILLEALLIDIGVE